jgi:hypothetical protein
VKTHYELLGLEPTADADTIKKAFRREIARYHPDKVVHLGAEFQDMAATRAAELTVADAALRAEYDANLSAAPAPVAPPAAEPRDAPPPAEPAFRPPTIDEIKTPAPRGNPARFASERADRDNILRRAIGARVRATVEELYGKVDTPTVRGFDLAMIPVAKPRFLGSAPPRVLVKVVDLADSAAIAEAWNAAGRARVHAGKSPVIVLVFSTRVADQAELSKGWDGVARQRKAPEAPDDLTVVVVNVADWSCRLPPNTSTAVQKLSAKICA